MFKFVFMLVFIKTFSNMQIYRTRINVYTTFAFSFNSFDILSYFSTLLGWSSF